MYYIVTYVNGMYKYLSNISSETKFLFLDTYHPDNLYLCEQECEDPW